MRVGDPFVGTCNTHGPITGVITSGSSIATADTKAMARVGDKGDCSCGHKFTITTGSSVVKEGSTGYCRVGDAATVDIVGGNLTAQSSSSVVDCA